MTSYDIDHGLPKSCLGPYFMFLTFFMEYLTYSGRAAKSTWREKSEKKAKKRGGIIRDIQVVILFDMMNALVEVANLNEI